MLKTSPMHLIGLPSSLIKVPFILISITKSERIPLLLKSSSLHFGFRVNPYETEMLCEKQWQKVLHTIWIYFSAAAAPRFLCLRGSAHAASSVATPFSVPLPRTCTTTSPGLEGAPRRQPSGTQSIRQAGAEERGTLGTETRGLPEETPSRRIKIDSHKWPISTAAPERLAPTIGTR